MAAARQAHPSTSAQQSATPQAPAASASASTGVAARQHSGGSTSGAASRPIIPAAHTPTPAQQSGIPTHGPRRTLAPSAPPERNPDAPDPARSLAERTRAAIAARTGANAERRAVEAAGEDPPRQKATTEPDAKSEQQPSQTGSRSDASPKPSTEPLTSGSEGPESKSSPQSGSEKPASDGSETSGTATPSETTPKGPRYDVKSFRRWAEEHPEEAAEIGAQVFQVGQDVKSEWVRLTNKRRKLREEIRTERETMISEATARAEAAEAAKARAEEVAGQIRWLSDMWAATQLKDAQGNPRPDFDTIDEAFRQNAGGLSIDDYMRMRARRGASNPETARLRAELARAKAEAEAAKRGGAQAPAGEPAPAASPEAKAAPAAPAAAAPAAPAVDWGSELPKGHKLRQFADWEQLLGAEMAKYHDPDLGEYTADPEEIADKILRRQIEEFAAAEAPEPPKPKPKTPGRRPSAAAPPGAPAKPLPPPPEGHKVGLDARAEDFEGTFAERKRWALDRAMRRARGEAV